MAFPIPLPRRLWSRALFAALTPLALWLSAPGASLPWLLPFALVPWVAVSMAGGRFALALDYAIGMALQVLWVPFIAQVTAVGYVITIVVEGLLFPLVGFSLRGPLRRWPLAFALALSWTAWESFRGVWPLDGFPWLLLGHGAAGVDLLLASSAWWGVAGVSALIAASAGAMANGAFRTASSGARRLAALVVFLWVGLFAWNPAFEGNRGSESEEGPSVLLAQPSIPQEVKRRSDVLEIFHTQLSLTREGLVSAETLLAHTVRGALFGAPYVPPIPDGFDTPSTADGIVRPRERFGPDLVAWPETMLLWRDGEAPSGESYRPGEEGALFQERDLRMDTGLRLQMLSAGELQQRGTSLLAGQLYVIADGAGGFSERNSMQLFDRAFAHAPVARYDKLKLVPGGEYIPLIDHVPFAEKIRSWIKGVAGYLPELDPGAGPGVLHLGRAEGDDWGLGAAICLDNAYEDVFRGAVRRGADAHVVLSNEGWFRGSDEQDHMMTFSAFRAVETGRAVLRVTNTGVASLFDHAGRATRVLRDAEGLDRDVPGWMWVRVPIERGETVYARGGWWIGPGSTVILFTFLLWGALVRLVRARDAGDSSPEEARKLGNQRPTGL